MRCLHLALTFAAALATTSPGMAQQTNTGLRGMAGANEALSWQAVGRLDATGMGFCTGTLVSPEYVLTAAHCVYSTRTGELIPPEDLTFRAGLRNGRVAAERKITQIEAHPNYTPGHGSVPQNIRHDVALLRLERAIPTSDLDPFILHAQEISSGPVSVVSYGRKRENLPSRQDVCQVRGTQQGIMLMDCDVTFGSSGAPVFSHANGRGQIVSVISGIGFYNGERITYGMTLPKLVAELKQQMWANKAKPVAQIKRIQVGSGALNSGGGSAKFVRPSGS